MIYFFQVLTVRLTAEKLRTNEHIMKEYLSEIIQLFGDEIAGRNAIEIISDE